MKPVLHSWLKQLQTRELYSGIKLLLISVVILPVLPDKGFGPWQSLNPYLIWWMVVLIATLSFTAYITMQLIGPRKGVLISGLLGGLVSSTATTLHLSHLAKYENVQKIITGGIIITAATMLPRVLIEVMVVNHQLLPYLWLPLLSMLIAAIVCLLIIRPWQTTQQQEAIDIHHPMDLWLAIKFGLLLGLIMLLSKALQHWGGNTGIYVLAAISGLVDVDAITLSLANMAKDEIQAQVASRAIIIAVIVNTFVKAALASWIGGAVIARRLIPAFGLIILCGISSLLFINN